MSSSLSRLLYRSFCTSTSQSTLRNPASPPFKTLLDEVFHEQDLGKLVERFKKSSEFYRFRCKHRVYEVTVRRLAAANLFSSVEQIIEHQKKYNDISHEGFAIRLIDLYGQAGMFDHAQTMFDELPELKCERTVKSFNALLNACIDSKNYDKVEKVFQEFPSKLSITPDEYSYNILIRAYCEMGTFDSAISVLDEMEKKKVGPGVVSFNTILSALYRRGRLSEGDEFWARMEKSNVVPDVRSFNAKLRGLVHEKKTAEAIKLVEEMKGGETKPDVNSFNYLIKGFCKDGNLVEAKKIYDGMLENGCAPCRSTFDMLVPCVCENGNFVMAFKLCKESLSRKLFLDESLLQTVVDGLVKESKVEKAKKLVEIAKKKNSYYDLSLDIPPSDEQ